VSYLNYLPYFETSLEHRINLPFDEIKKYIRQVEGYNDFEWRRVYEVLDQFDALIPRQYYNEGNPNNGKRLYDLYFGREGSPVLYLIVTSFGKDKESEAIRLILENQRNFEAIASKTGCADEFSVDINDTDFHTELVMRLWWD
jgi:hypothetical protein